MSRFLKEANENWTKAAAVRRGKPEKVSYLLASTAGILLHLEALEATWATETPSAPSSSVATETAEATSDTWSISSAWLSHVNPDGYLTRSVLPGIKAFLNSLVIPGNVQEVEIGVTLHNKASTSPAGSL